MILNGSDVIVLDIQSAEKILQAIHVYNVKSITDLYKRLIKLDLMDSYEKLHKIVSDYEESV